MADTYTLPALTAADINGIVTAGQDGTYNITYTNLTANQIQQIGNAFEAAMQTNLKDVALNGEYNDLNVKPGIPTGYTQESNFNKVAFSGKASDLDNTDNTGEQVFLTSFTESDPVFAASAAATITNTQITKWNNQSSYSNLDDLPAQDLLYNFSKIAFTGDYNDLLLNIPAEKTINDYIFNLDLSEAENQNLANLLTIDNQIIENCSNLKIKSTDTISLEQWLYTMIEAFNEGKSTTITNNKYNYLITDIVPMFTENPDGFYYEIFMTPSFITNYNDIRNNLSNLNTNINNITITKKQPILFFDKTYDLLICKII